MDYQDGREPWTIEQYGQWMRDTQRELHDAGIGELVGFFSLDVIRDPAATRRNFETLVEQGLRPLPILTHGSSEQDARRYAEYGERVGIGGLVSSAKHTPGYLEARTAHLPAELPQHWLGVTDPRILSAHKPASVDAASWIKSLSHAMLTVYVGRGKLDVLNINAEEKLTGEHRAALRRLGFNPERVLHERTATGGVSHIVQAASIASYVEYMRDFDRAMGIEYFISLALQGNINTMLLQTLTGGPCAGHTTKAVRQRLFSRSKRGELALREQEVCRHDQF